MAGMSDHVLENNFADHMHLILLRENFMQEDLTFMDSIIHILCPGLVLFLLHYDCIVHYQQHPFSFSLEFLRLSAIHGTLFFNLKKLLKISHQKLSKQTYETQKLTYESLTLCEVLLLLEPRLNQQTKSRNQQLLSSL